LGGGDTAGNGQGAFCGTADVLDVPMHSICKNIKPYTYDLCIFCLNIAAVAAKLLHLCPTLCDPIDGSPPGSPVPGVLQARTLEWVAISFSNA